MKKIYTVLAAALLAAAALGVTQQRGRQEQARPTPKQPATVVGIFDSRAVAVAYVRSNRFNTHITELQNLLQQAQESGDEEAVAMLQAEGPRLQAQVHRQAFGKESVEGILEHVRGKLPELCKEKGVEILISKWAVTYRTPTAKLVDVTRDMAQLFNPDEETREVIRELLKTKPLSNEELDEQ